MDENKRLNIEKRLFLKVSQLLLSLIVVFKLPLKQTKEIFLLTFQEFKWQGPVGRLLKAIRIIFSGIQEVLTLGLLDVKTNALNHSRTLQP